MVTDPTELVFLITSVAVTISKAVPESDQLELLAVTFTQLGDTLATIVQQRSVLEKKAQDNSNQDNSKQDNSNQCNPKQDNSNPDENY